MNQAYIPILGEFDGTRLKLNIISFIDDDLFVQVDKEFYTLKLRKYTSNSCTILITQSTSIHFKLNDCVDRIDIRLPQSLLEKVYVFNCDCHFLPETGTWQTVDTSKTRLAFHVGDQIYFDEVYVQLTNRCAAEHTNDEVRAILYETAKMALLRKTNVLQGCFNIMLGDDHDICDDSFRNEAGKNIISHLTQIYFEIQASLRLTNKTQIQYDSVKILLIDNIRSRNDAEYLKHLIEEIKKVELKSNDVFWIMSPRVPMNNNIDCCTRLIYKKQTNLLDYTELYKLFTNPTKIFCGDEHIARRFSIGARCELLFVGTMNSVLDGYDSRDYVEGIETQRLSNNKTHSYVVIESGIARHKLVKSCLNSWFGCLVYCMKLKCGC